MIPKTKIPTIGQRLVSMFVDHFIMTIIICIGSLILALPLFFLNGNKKTDELRILGGGFFMTFIFMLVSLYLNKDILNGRSPAKRILKFQVVDNDTEVTASPMKCLLRNMTIIIWPIEVIATFFNPSQRLGDKLANTKIVVFDELKDKERIDKKAVLKALFIGLFAFLGISMLVILFQLSIN